MATSKIRVLIVDDSVLMRMMLSRILSDDPGIEVVGTAEDPIVARKMITELSPDVITLDVEMPHMDGITFLEKLMADHPMPVVMISTLTTQGADTTMRALELGAVDFFPKPTSNMLKNTLTGASEIVWKVKSAAQAKVKPVLHSTPPVVASNFGSLRNKSLIAIGASTGGTEAIRAVLSTVPADCPPILIVQHMPPGFTTSFAKRLTSLSAIQVIEAQDGDRVLPGQALLAPGGSHMSLVRSGGSLTVRINQDAPVNRHRPSVDVLFRSVAKYMGAAAVGVILTGMGADGADCLKELRDTGAHTIAQDEATCIVYGMPREAFERGGAEKVLPLGDIAHEMLAMAVQASKASPPRAA